MHGQFKHTTLKNKVEKMMILSNDPLLISSLFSNKVLRQQYEIWSVTSESNLLTQWVKLLSPDIIIIDSAQYSINAYRPFIYPLLNELSINVMLYTEGGVKIISSPSKINSKNQLNLEQLISPNKQCGLSPKEVEVLKLLSKGLSQKIIADQMNISINSVKTFINRSYKKLDVHSVTEAIAKVYLENGKTEEE